MSVVSLYVEYFGSENVKLLFERYLFMYYNTKRQFSIKGNDINK